MHGSVKLMSTNFVHSIAIVGPWWIALLIRIVVMVRTIGITSQWLIVHLVRPGANAAIDVLVARPNVTILPALELTRLFAHILDSAAAPVGLVLGSPLADHAGHFLLSVTRFTASLAVDGLGEYLFSA